ncbi:hypothetical protein YASMINEVIRUS_796 [Yasminevirus sp. GU-2018]|uniref:Uncharacterized protein n=1 Tax=Yasminevirus sp. GU-2018 TaxID=2420051 RepID=A0A5K0UA59_9VIRU|nr:hypothetical protein YASMINEVIRUS_796 [Yasminevirus sp. GU-2018]
MTDNDSLSLNGVNFLFTLRQKYTKELDSLYFCLNSCPYQDIRDGFTKSIDATKRNLSLVNKHIEDYSSACFELEHLRATSFGNVSTEEYRFRTSVLKKVMRDAEEYNKTMCLAYTVSLLMDHLVKLAK